MTPPTGFTSTYGLTISPCGEDNETFVALGHHDDRRMTAAANRLLRTVFAERYRPAPGEPPRISHTFAVITEHQADEDGEGGGWTFTIADPSTAGAHPITLLDTEYGLGDFELLAKPSRCPDCTRLATTGHYMSAKMRAVGAPSPLGHDCRNCGAIWPATPRSTPIPDAAA